MNTIKIGNMYIPVNDVKKYIKEELQKVIPMIKELYF